MTALRETSEDSLVATSLLTGCVAAGDLHFTFLRHLRDELGAPVQERCGGKRHKCCTQGIQVVIVQNDRQPRKLAACRTSQEGLRCKGSFAGSSGVASCAAGRRLQLPVQAGGSASQCHVESPTIVG